MNEIYKKNIAALESKNTILFGELKDEIEFFEQNPNGTEQESYTLSKVEGFDNLIYEKKGLIPKSYYHASNPHQEASFVIENVDLKHPTFVSIFGMGLGYLLKAFLKNRPSGNFAVVVIEKNPQIFLRALCVHDFSETFGDESIGWIITPDPRMMQAKANTLLQIHNTVCRIIRILATPKAMETENQFYAECAERLLSARDHVTIICGNSVEDSWLGFKNTIDNLYEATQNPGLSPLMEQFEGRVCISVAAGPSLNEHWDTLRALQGKVPIIAVDTLLKPMNEQGVQPDFITALERDDYVSRFFHNIPVGKRTTLVGPTLLLKDSYDFFKGDKVMYAPMPSFSLFLRLGFLRRFNGGASAGNLNINLARALGFKTIILVGHNLAYGYKTNESHVKGTIDKDRERSRSTEEMIQNMGGHQVSTQDGTDVVWTRADWHLFRYQLEDFTATHRDITLINTAPKGAKISGAKLMTLEDALKTYVKDDFDIFPVKQKLLALPPKELRDERLRDSLIGAKTGQSRLEFWMEECDRHLKNLKTWRKKIEDKELEGKFVSSEWLDRCLDEVLTTKVKAVNLDPYFHNAALSVLFPYHMAFERILNEMPGIYKSEYELKRDFLLKHEQYYEVWQKWLPKMAKTLKDLVDAHPEFKIDALPLKEQFLEADPNLKLLGEALADSQITG